MKDRMGWMFVCSAAFIFFFSLLAGCKGTFKAPSTPFTLLTPTPTDTPCAYCTPTFTKTNTPVPPTPTFTPNGTVTIPMGLYIAAAFDGSVISYGGYSVTVSGNTVALCYNRAADHTATVQLTTPSNGVLTLPWVQDGNFGTYVISQYASTSQFTYTPNALYSVSVSGTWGTSTASLYAPGNITFAVNGGSVTAAYPGNLDQAQVAENSPTARSVFVSPASVNVGSPYTYPLSAFPDSPGNYTCTFSAGLTVAMSAPAASGSAFVGNQTNSVTVNR